jgi:hypothetical protein
MQEIRSFYFSKKISLNHAESVAEMCFVNYIPSPCVDSSLHFHVRDVTANI